MTRQSVLDSGDDNGNSQHSKTKKQCPDATFFGTPGSRVTDHSDDAGAGIACPIKLAGRLRYQNRDTDKYSNDRRGGELHRPDDSIALGKMSLVNEATSDAEREEMRKSQTERRTPN
jgi:hypothetical protein